MIGVDGHLRPALDKAGHGAAALALEQRWPVGIFVLQVERDFKGIRNDLFSITYDRDFGGIAILKFRGISLKEIGLRPKGRPLCANDITVFQQCGLKGTVFVSTDEFVENDCHGKPPLFG